MGIPVPGFPAKENIMIKTCMVFPSYWARRSEEGWVPGDAVYDHPIPLDEEGTLLRALKSLQILESKDFEVLVLAVPTSDEIADDVEEKVSGIIREAEQEVEIPLRIFGPSHLRRVHKVLDREGKGALKDLLKLRGYSNVRNLCVFVPHLLEMETAILIDDDEVFEDPEFIDKALEVIGKNIEGNPVYAVAGYYLQPDGSYRVKKAFEPWMKRWDQIDRMNEAFDNYIGKPPRFKVTPFVFGGNMVIHRKLFTKVPFDPLVPRGEDIDYLINARMFGFKFFLDNTLSIKHLPPPKTHPVWRRLREDVFRFLFEREKIRHQKEREEMVRVFPEDFDPYPGAFLKDDLEEKVEKASRTLAEQYRKERNKTGAQEAMQTVSLMREALENGQDPFDDMVRLQARWQALMNFVDRPSVRTEITRFL